MSTVLANIYFFKGDLNQAIKYGKQSLSSKMIGVRPKLTNIELLGGIYSTR